MISREWCKEFGTTAGDTGTAYTHASVHNN